MKRLSILALLMLSAAPSAGSAQTAPAAAPTPAPASPPARTDAELRAIVDAFAATVVGGGQSAGLAVGVAERGRIRLVRGYGFADLEGRVPATERTVFRIGSVTKEFTAAAVLLLADQGKLSIDDPLAKHLPGFPRAGEVTLRQLLSHTSGIRNYTSIPQFFGTTGRLDRTADELVGTIAGQAPLYDFEPGSAFSYSNSGYVLLGAVVEKVSGQSFDRFLKSAILDPLELRDTALDDVSQTLPNRARGYDKAKEPATGFTNASVISMSAAGAAGAMRSTVADLLKWHGALLGGRLLKPATVAVMTTPGRLKDGRPAIQGWPKDIPATIKPFAYGLGMIVDRQGERRTVGHGGSIQGFNASLQTLPDHEVSLVLLTNTSGAAYGSMPKLIEAYFGAPQP